MGTDAQDQATTEVRDNAEAERYVLTRDGDLAGTIMYRQRPGLQRQREYTDLVPEAYRAEFGLA
jgi:hypothetical protein